MEEKICPYCYKNIQGCYGTVDEDSICPHPDCGKKIPKIYLQYPTKHVASIVNNTCAIKDFGDEIEDYAKNDNAEKISSRVEYYESDESDDNVRFILYEYIKEEFSLITETVVIAIHKCIWNDINRVTVSNIEHASAILLNIDISELKALYFNLGIKRSRKDFENWNSKSIGKFVREIADYLKRNQLTRKVAILFGNLQYLRNHPYFRDEKRYQRLLEIIQDWTSDYADRKWIVDADETIRDLLMELGEERLIKDADGMSDLKFFLYPSSEYRMTSNTFWMMAVLLWICTKID